jgi:hypothetical protein
VLLLAVRVRLYLSAALALFVRFVASADVLVEFFMGTRDNPMSVLAPKGRRERWITPPYSLGFNLIVNPH